MTEPISPQENIEMAERALGLDEGNPDYPSDPQETQAHALMAIAGHLSRIADALDMHNTIAFNQ